MKEKLIEKYGEKQAEVLINKFTEDEIYENGFLQKELPDDPKWQEMFLDMEKQNKELKAQLDEKLKHIHNLNEENKDKRLNLENEKLTKEQIAEKLKEIQKEKDDLASQLETYKDYKELKEFYTIRTEAEQKRKMELLQKVDESKRDALSKLDISEIELFVNNEIPEKTPGIDNQKAPTSTDNLGGLKDLFNALKGNN